MSNQASSVLPDKVPTPIGRDDPAAGGRASNATGIIAGTSSAVALLVLILAGFLFLRRRRPAGNTESSAGHAYETEMKESPFLANLEADSEDDHKLGTFGGDLWVRNQEPVPESFLQSDPEEASTL
jgi:uncharacterized protein (TIGR03382 family)